MLHTHDVEAFRESGYAAPDVYFRAEYGAAEEAAGSGRWLMFEAFEGRWLMPVHIRESPIATDAVSPYGYAGIYADPELSTSQARAAWDEARSALLDLGCISVFVRQSPLVASGWEGPGGEIVVRDHPTFQIDITDIAVAWDRMQGRSRTSIRKSQRMGMSARVRYAEWRDLASGSPFRVLYEQGMQRRSASDRYVFPDEYYEILLGGLGTDLLIAEVSDSVGGAVVASSLLMLHGDQLHYHLSGSDIAAGRNGATNALLWAAIQWAGDSGVRSFHLGGGLAPGDSLHKFKASFGGDELRFSAYGVVLDERAYQWATDVRASELGVPARDLSAMAGTFPRYRSTL
ncbi:hypothetical protein GCM10011509_29740 [Ornithinimicrobium pekingense]|uniref:BioF2-like acetyltransferase domain-containing protein n=1 Tax=Ornithinimicrobium pekingense TaxID=384677 RepID=A0ABQ2FBV0_9MICO|nr:hypothetical protein GCM10011509_29740 [Ornithinimicrobium pekingense]